MNSFFADLKRAREARGISLAEISDATLISMKMLEALESGDHKVVPQAYLRAFIREYAAVIGLDKEERMRRYDAWLREKDAVAAKQADQPVLHQPPADTSPLEVKESGVEKFQRLAPTFFKIGLAVIVLILIDIVLWSVLEKEPAQQVQERPFRDVIREQEQLRGVSDSGTVATVSSRPGRPHYYSSDSLVLVATTTDTVWMEIVIDDEILTEHLLRPKSSFTWKAKNEFWISAIGNPTAIKFTLNGRPIVHPVRRGLVTRNVRVTRDSLKAR